ncbi:MAG: RAMP superfamily CRISPR-associated protein [Candidatus Rokuibacteriota bacterium]
MNRYSVDLTLELLSPCFLGGAFQQPEFRIASLRGIWRYWYRALYGRGDEDRPWEDERRIFGGVGVEDDGNRRQPSAATGRGSARLVLRESSRGLNGSEWSPSRPPSGADYLLFSMGMNKRQGLNEGQTVLLRLLLAKDGEEADRAVRSFLAACAFSGLGARSRHMAGAVSLGTAGPVGPIAWIRAGTPDALAGRLRELIQPSLGRRVGQPRYHIVASGAFRAGVLQRVFRTWREALDTIGSALRSFRLRREPDYSIAKGVAHGQRLAQGQTITRAAFGLPIQFRFRSLGGSGFGVEMEASDRRGSPLFLTLERLADPLSPIAVVWCLFRSPLTPDGSIRIGQSSAPAPDLSIIDEMLRRPEFASHAVAE